MGFLQITQTVTSLRVLFRIKAPRTMESILLLFHAYTPSSDRLSVTYTSSVERTYRSPERSSARDGSLVKAQIKE